MSNAKNTQNPAVYGGSIKKGYGKLKWISLQQMLKKVNRGNNKQRGAVVG